jgi:peptidoglycan/xylan/chitin deacetylase (PgdA/CDA1 family)
MAQWLVDLVHYFEPSIIFNFDPALSVCPDTGKGLAALTIDDGPLENAEEILDILKENDVRATWFVISEHMDRYPQSVKRIIAEGHEIQNHVHQSVSLQRLMCLVD